jgi:hypothetical protein
VLGWESQVSLEEGSKRTYEWIEEQVKKDKEQGECVLSYGK